MTQQTAFEKFWKKECKANGVKDTDSAFKAFALHGWNAAIDATHMSLLENQRKFSSSAEMAIDQCVEEIQKLRS